ncbi:uncharacterized protein LOC130906070 [Corythoichthys intestinalis]|uniref:uncharacterized protein LOC130906070 n=1 Tax=Corythoichthys intestinalis TaxID=161448 RepID=UPI0025A60486|nr:uncharacterized protein LOC130906070 [Corythoichthys intestinalis]
MFGSRNGMEAGADGATRGTCADAAVAGEAERWTGPHKVTERTSFATWFISPLPDRQRPHQARRFLHLATHQGPTKCRLTLLDDIIQQRAILEAKMRNFTPRMMMHSFGWLFGLSLLLITSADDCPVPVSTEIVTIGAYGAESSTSVTTSGECVSIPGNEQVTFEFDACRYYPCGWASKSHYYLSSISWSYETTVAYSGNDWQISCQSRPRPVECGKMADLSITPSSCGMWEDG